MSLASLLAQPTMWGLLLTQGCQVYSLYLFLTWLPTYLITVRHVRLFEAGWLGMLPYLIATLGSVGFGILSDRLLGTRDLSTGVRRVVVIVLMLLASCVLLVPLVNCLVAMEVLEHVTNVKAFVATCGAMVKPRGLMIAATLNRTLKSFALAIVGAEYVLRWVPRGTHQWDKFVTPDELERAFERGGLDIIGERGVVYNPFADRWQLASDMDVNYMLVGEKRAQEGSAA